MTVIEFFDKNATENIASALLCKPEKVIVIGHDFKKIEKHIKAYSAIIEKHGACVEFVPKSLNRNNLSGIINSLCEIVEENENCVFDLTGGEDLFLVAVGVILEKYAGRVQCHRFNLRNETLIDCDADGNVCNVGSFDLSVDEIIALNGGVVVRDPERESYTYPWDLNPDFALDVHAAWNICRENPGAWNAQIGTIGAVCDIFKIPENELAVSFNREAAAAALKNRSDKKYVMMTGMLYALKNAGLISSLLVGDDISFVFKNEQVKQLLTIEGQVLELIVADALNSALDEDGNKLYNDVQVGVVIDWDGKDDDSEFESVNEIDVIAVKGMIPVFISCKNGKFDVNELYKLSTVTERFGGEYAKKVLVTSEIDKFGKGELYLNERFKDMRIRPVKNVDEMTDAQLCSALRYIYNN